MALPLTRNETYSDGTPVRPGTINDLQDGITAAKHGAIVVPFPAAAFQIACDVSAYAAEAIPEFDGFTWNFGLAPTGRVVAPVLFSVGTKINKLRWKFLKGGSAAGLTMRLVRIGLGTDLRDHRIDMIAWTDTSSSGVWQEYDAAGPVIIEASYQYMLIVDAGNISHAFQGVDAYIVKE